MPPPAQSNKVRRMDRESDASHARKSVLRAMLSHIGLFLIVAVYVVIGAFVFQKLEADTELIANKYKKKITLDITDSKGYIIHNMWFQNGQNLTAKAFKAIAIDNLKQFHDFVVRGVSDFGYDGDTNTVIHDWTFTSSLLFTFTTVAAIGYGHITPKSRNGQIFCIFYGLVGVPLLLVFLANIGDALARSFRYIYSRGCCVVCRLTRRKNENKPGLPPQSIFKDEVGTEKYMPTFEVQVPITVNVCVLAAYLTLGGLLFKVLEGWQFHEAAYFSFITLSTIGFGDYSPGNSFDVATDTTLMIAVKMCAAIAYSLFGMALLSMCINLIQEQIVNKMRWLARELGMGVEEDKSKVKEKSRKVNADGSAIETAPDKDGNTDYHLQNIEEKPAKKFRKRYTYDDFDEI